MTLAHTFWPNAQSPSHTGSEMVLRWMSLVLLERYGRAMGLDARQVQARLQYHAESERHPIPEVDAVVSRHHCPE